MENHDDERVKPTVQMSLFSVGHSESLRQFEFVFSFVLKGIRDRAASNVHDL